MSKVKKQATVSFRKGTNSVPGAMIIEINDPTIVQQFMAFVAARARLELNLGHFDEVEFLSNTRCQLDEAFAQMTAEYPLPISTDEIQLPSFCSGTGKKRKK